MNRPKSKREKDNEKISREIQTVQKRVARLMRSLGIKSKVARKFKAKTDSNHFLPVAENLLNRDFHAEERSHKWVSDIICVSSDEGWLY